MRKTSEQTRRNAGSLAHGAFCTEILKSQKFSSALYIQYKVTVNGTYQNLMPVDAPSRSVAASTGASWAEFRSPPWRQRGRT
jgi:hypothetical protein